MMAIRISPDEGVAAFRKAIHIARQLNIPYLTTSTVGTTIRPVGFGRGPAP